MHLQTINLGRLVEDAIKLKGACAMSWYYEVIAPEKWLTRAVKREASVGEERNCCAGRLVFIGMPYQ